MKLLFLTNIYPTSDAPGRAAFIDARVRALRDRGVSVDAVAVGAVSSHHRPTVRSDYVDGLLSLPAPVRALLGNDRVLLRAERRSAFALTQVIDTSSYDAILAHGMYRIGAGRLAGSLARAQGVPYSVHLHGSDINLLMANSRRLFQETLSEARAAVFVSEALLGKARTLGYQGQNAHVIQNGVDTEIFSPSLRHEARARLGIPPDAPVVSFVGNLVAVKGADRVPAIFHAIARLSPATRYLVVGAGPLASRIVRHTDDLNVALFGQVEQSQVAQVMAASDVVVVPSRNEGWGCVIHEAYACGADVVAANVGGISEAIATPERLVQPGPDFVHRFAGCVIGALRPKTGSPVRPVPTISDWHKVVDEELGLLRLP